MKVVHCSLFFLQLLATGGYKCKVVGQMDISARLSVRLDMSARLSVRISPGNNYLCTKVLVI